MLRAARARRIAAATAFGGGGLTLVGAGTVVLLHLQVRLARNAIGTVRWARPPVDGLHGRGEGPPIRMLMAGDSTAAGFAVEEAAQTPGVMLARGLSAVAERPVLLHCTAVPGATSADLAQQLEHTGVHGGQSPYDLAVIFIGANDVIRRVSPNEAVSHLRATTEALVGSGTGAVVATCPDLGTVRPIGWPLRSVARRASRQLAAAQTIAVTEAGGRTVSMSDVLSGEFTADPTTMFGPDHFHPSAAGYAQAAFAVLPSACAAMGLLPGPERDRGTGEGMLPADRAAVVAAETAGTEVAPLASTGEGRTRRGRWITRVRLPFRRAPRSGSAEDAPSQTPDGAR